MIRKLVAGYSYILILLPIAFIVVYRVQVENFVSAAIAKDSPNNIGHSEPFPELTRKYTPQMIDFPNNIGHSEPILELTKENTPFFPTRVTTGGKKITKDMFSKSETCGACHTEIYKQWKQSAMAHSWDDPIFREILRRGAVATGGAVNNFCTGCHTPIGTTTGTPSVFETTSNHDPGVNCETCHNISGVTATENGAFVLTPKMFGNPLKFGPRKDAVSPFHDTAYSELHTNSKFCSTCHNVSHPFNKMPVERTYTEWEDSVYNKKGIQCQDCHIEE